VQQRRQQGAQEARSQVSASRPERSDELGDQRPAVAADQQQRRHRPDALAGLQPGRHRLAPDRAEQVLVAVRDGVVAAERGQDRVRHRHRTPPRRA
jgi:hypothetical protein